MPAQETKSPGRSALTTAIADSGMARISETTPNPKRSPQESTGLLGGAGAAGDDHLLLGQVPAHPAVDRAVQALLDLPQERVDQARLVLFAELSAGVQSGVEFLLEFGVTGFHSPVTVRARAPRSQWG